MDRERFPPAGITSNSMIRKLIIDAGPIVAYLDRNDPAHHWAVSQFERFVGFETCEPVLAEACARLHYGRIDQTRAAKLVHENVLKLTFELSANIGRIVWLMEKYQDRPMDLADACIVMMAEAEEHALVLTLDDDDFSVYRRNGRDLIPFASPKKALG